MHSLLFRPFFITKLVDEITSEQPKKKLIHNLKSSIFYRNNLFGFTFTNAFSSSFLETTLVRIIRDMYTTKILSSVKKKLWWENLDYSRVS